MSTLGDAMNAIKSVLLMQSNLERMQRDMERMSGDLAGVREAVVMVDRRVVRLEALQEAAGASGGRQPPLIEH